MLCHAKHIDIMSPAASGRERQQTRSLERHDRQTDEAAIPKPLIAWWLSLRLFLFSKAAMCSLAVDQLRPSPRIWPSRSEPWRLKSRLETLNLLEVLGTTLVGIFFPRLVLVRYASMSKRFVRAVVSLGRYVGGINQEGCWLRRMCGRGGLGNACWFAGSEGR
jgi:hypothetical protein